MKIIATARSLVTAGLLGLITAGCSSNPLDALNSQPPRLPLIPGEVTLQISKNRLDVLRIPDSTQINTGGILSFSPIEFTSIKNHFGIETATLPLGRYVAVRHSGEGISAGLLQDDVRSFDVHYNARYPDLNAALRDFPGLEKQRYQHVMIGGKAEIEIEQWHIRLSMIFSRQHRAFRVLLDRLDYTAPSSHADTEADQPAQDSTQELPVVVAFSYRHPDSVRETLIQQNIVFEFRVNDQHGRFQGRPQVSGWMPLPVDAETVPYTVGIVVAEVHEKREDFYKKLYNMVKNVRGLM